MEWATLMGRRLPGHIVITDDWTDRWCEHHFWRHVSWMWRLNLNLFVSLVHFIPFYACRSDILWRAFISVTRPYSLRSNSALYIGSIPIISWFYQFITVYVIRFWYYLLFAMMRTSLYVTWIRTRHRDVVLYEEISVWTWFWAFYE